MTQTISQLHDLEEYTEILSKDTLSTNEKTLEGISQPDILQQIALGLTYHEICVLHFMLGKDKSYAPYAGKALTVLTAARPNAPDWSLPMLDSYINSSRSLVAATKGNLISLLKVIRTYDKLIDTGLELGLSKSAAGREVGKIVGRLADAADEIIAQMESILADPAAPQGAPSPMTKAAERRMLRSIRSIVIADMLRYVRLPVAAAK